MNQAYKTSSILLNAMYTEISEMANMINAAPSTTKASIEGIAIPVTVEVSGLTGGQTGDSSSTRRRNLDWLLDKVKHDCSAVKCTLEDSLRIAAETVKMDSNADIYGMIWASTKNNNIRLNVLHPIVVQAILTGDYNHVVPLTEDGTLYIYEYRNTGSTFKLEEPFSDEVIERWTEILTVVTVNSAAPNVTLKCSTNMESLCQSIRSGQTNLNSAQVNFSEAGNNPQKVITPLMFVTQGMLFPYYGAVQSRYSGGRYESRDLMHFGSCNLDHRRDIGAWSSTCTGNLSNSVYASLRVLTNLNTGSPHHTDVITAKCEIKTYVKITQEISVQLLEAHYKDVWKTEEATPVPEAVVTKEEKKAEVTVLKKIGRPSKSTGGR